MYMRCSDRAKVLVFDTRASVEYPLSSGLQPKGTMDFQSLLRFAVDHGASDVHIQAGLPPALRIGGILKGTTLPAVGAEELTNVIVSIAPKRFQDNIEDRLTAGMDFGYAAPNISRFRCSAYRHLGPAGISL